MSRETQVLACDLTALPPGGKERLVDRALPIGVGGRQKIAAAGLADVVDEHVDAAEPIERLRDNSFGALSSGHVGHDGQYTIGISGGFDERGSGRAERVAAARTESQPAVFRDERLRGGQTEPSARPGDDGDFISEEKIHVDALV